MDYLPEEPAVGAAGDAGAASRPTLIRAAAVADGDTVAAAPGSVLLEGGAIVAAGSPSAVTAPRDAVIIDLPDHVVLPALVNSHSHLDLSHLGPVPFTGDFVSWVEQVRRRRAVDPGAIEASVKRGIELAIAGGTAVIGDIAGAGSLVPLQVQRRVGMAGVSFLEVFGLGRRQSAAIERLLEATRDQPAELNGVRLGLQPHAPYSCGPRVFAEAARLGLPMATHCAETLEELAFVAEGGGPLREMIERLGVWDESIEALGAHPVEALARWVDGRPCLAAHCNYIEDRHVQLLADSSITVAYCPRASAYFGHPQEGHGPHRYQQLLYAGVNVVLGTDSILCLPTADRLSVLDDMRLLYARDQVDARRLLAMGTINGADALGFDRQLFTLAPGPTAGLISVAVSRVDPRDPLAAVMRSEAAPSWVVGPVTGGQW